MRLSSAWTCISHPSRNAQRSSAVVPGVAADFGPLSTLSSDLAISAFGAGVDTLTITPGLISDTSVFISFCEDMPDLELDFEIAGEGTLDEWRVDAGVSLVSLFRALLGVLMGGRAGVFPRPAAADAACALARFPEGTNALRLKTRPHAHLALLSRSVDSLTAPARR